MNNGISLGLSIKENRFAYEDLYPTLAFVSTWQTTAPNETITLPYEAAGTYSGTIDWGDGTTDINDFSNKSHTYDDIGTYQIIIQGETTGFNFYTSGLSGSDSFKILSIDQWGLLKFINYTAMYNFYLCTNLNISNVIGVLNTTGLTSLLGLFEACESLTSVKNINNWNLSNILRFDEMFYGCILFNQSLSFNMQNAINTTSMFQNCTSFNSSVNLNTVNVTNMSTMFHSCTSFNQELNFNTVNVTNMSYMFYNCSVFNTEFYFSSTANVITMDGMFQGCTFFNQLVLLDTVNVTSMVAMFTNCFSFNQETNFNTENVTNMSYMFQNCDAFNQDISNWDISNVLDFTNFMFGKTFNNYDSYYLANIYSNWSVLAVQPNLNINFGTIKFQSYGLAGKLVLLSVPNFWTITDGGII